MPTALKSVLGLSVFLSVLSWVFVGVFLTTRPESDMITGMLIAACTYTAMLVPIGLSLSRKNPLLLRASLGVNILASLPAKAIIGIVLSVIAIGLSLRASAKAYLAP